MSCISEAETNQNNKYSTIPFFSLVIIEKPNFSSVLFQIEIFFFIFECTFKSKSTGLINISILPPSTKKKNQKKYKKKKITKNYRDFIEICEHQFSRV